MGGVGGIYWELDMCTKCVEQAYMYMGHQNQNGENIKYSYNFSIRRALLPLLQVTTLMNKVKKVLGIYRVKRLVKKVAVIHSIQNF